MLDFRFSEPTGTWSGPMSFYVPGGDQTQLSQKSDSHGTYWNLLEHWWNLQPAWAKHEFSFSEPTGTCSELVLCERLAPTKLNFLENAIIIEPFGTSLNLCGTYALRGPNTTSASRNLLEPARNLFGFTHLASAKRNFLKNAFSRNLLEPCRNLDILREASYGIITFHVRPSSNIYY